MREERVASARFSWKTQHTYAKGTILSPQMPKAFNPKGLTIPPKDYTFEAKAALSFDHDKMRYHYGWRLWNGRLGRFVSDDIDDVYDGKTSVELSPASEAVDHPSATFRPEQRCRGLVNIQNRPLVLAYRYSSFVGANPTFGKLALSGKRPVRNAHTCVELNCKPSPFVTASLWVDPLLDYSVVRYAETNDGVDLWIIDVTYSKDEKHGWVPSQWTISAFNPDRSLREFSRVKLGEYEINTPLPANEFAIALQSGTLVIDDRAYPRRSSEFLVLPDGKQQPIPASDLHRPYSEIRQSALSRGQHHRPSLRKEFRLAVVVVLVVSFLLFIIIRNRKWLFVRR